MNSRKKFKLVAFWVVTGLAVFLGFATMLAGTTIVFAVSRSMLPELNGMARSATSAQTNTQTNNVSQPAGDQTTQMLAQNDLSQKALSQENAASPKTFSGLLTDSRCGARHSRALDKSAAECARFCVRHGAQYIIVNGGNRYRLAGHPSQLRGLAGQRVVVTGSLQGDAISVRSLNAAN